MQHVILITQIHRTKEEFYIVKPKATCHITRHASINTRASVRYSIQTVKQAAHLARDESLHINLKIEDGAL